LTAAQNFCVAQQSQTVPDSLQAGWGGGQEPASKQCRLYLAIARTTILERTLTAEESEAKGLDIRQSSQKYQNGVAITPFWCNNGDCNYKPLHHHV
jgi:hypothetical protein